MGGADSGNGEAQQRQPPRKRKSATARVLLALKRRVDKHYREQKEQITDHEHNERMLADWTRRLGQFTVVLAIVSIIGLGVSIKTLLEVQASGIDTHNLAKDTHTLADAALKQATAAQRQADALKGNIRFQGLKPFQTVMQAGTTMAEKPRIIGWEINPVFDNVGATNIKNYVGWWRILPQNVYDPKFTQDDALKITKCPTLAAPKETHNPQVIAPGSGQQLFAQFLSYNDAVSAAAQNPTRIIFLVGHFEWNDVFPDTPLHHMDWCIHLLPNDVNAAQFSQVNVFQTSD